MKSRLNLTIEEDILAKAKRYAEQKKLSLSEIIENYLGRMVSAPKKNTLIQLIENLPAPAIPESLDLKKEYHELKGKKYGS